MWLSTLRITMGLSSSAKQWGQVSQFHKSYSLGNGRPDPHSFLGFLISVNHMNAEERWNHIASLDDELLKGGVILSEWCSFIVRESDLAFVHGANLASILTAVSGIETYLRSEYPQGERSTLFELIDGASIADDLKSDLHKLRKCRNKWVHVNDPWDDQKLLDSPEQSERELEEMALFSARALRKTIYENQWV